jgi:hypothetical protein
MIKLGTHNLVTSLQSLPSKKPNIHIWVFMELHQARSDCLLHHCRINNGDHGLKHLGSVEFDVRDPVNIKHKTENCLVIMQNWELSTYSTDKFGLLIGSPCRSFQDKQENLRCRLPLRLY